MEISTAGVVVVLMGAERLSKGAGWIKEVGAQRSCFIRNGQPFRSSSRLLLKNFERTVPP
jgi:hypothetical protein